VLLKFAYLKLGGLKYGTIT